MPGLSPQLSSPCDQRLSRRDPTAHGQTCEFCMRLSAMPQIQALMESQSRQVDVEELRETAARVRRTIFRTICLGGGGHLPACFSIVEILTVLYRHILRVDPAEPKNPDRDRFVLSKGHAAVALYVMLAEMGFIDPALLETYGHSGTILGGHPDLHKLPGVEASTGAWGMGFHLVWGLPWRPSWTERRIERLSSWAMANARKDRSGKRHCSRLHRGLDNLTAIIDYNKLQASGSAGFDRVTGAAG